MAKDKDEDLTPTPTQAENDKAKLGGREPEKGEEKNEPKSEPKDVNRDAKPASNAGAGYQTRTTGKD